MYSRRLRPEGSDEERVLSFGVSGKLWNGMLVMFDRGSGSLWTQLDGRALDGSLLGERLEHVGSTFTTWEEWKRAHPDTLVLEKDAEARASEGSAYAGYFADPERLFVPELAEGLGGIGAKDTVYGLFDGREALAVEEEALPKGAVLNLVVGRRAVALVRAANGFVRAFDRVREGRPLLLGPAEGLDPGEALVDLLTGKPVDTADLQPHRVDRSFWYAWARSHPGSRALAR